MQLILIKDSQKKNRSKFIYILQKYGKFKEIKEGINKKEI